jgi:hypothetical protein
MDTEDVYEADVIQPKFNGGGLENSTITSMRILILKR